MIQFVRSSNLKKKGLLMMKRLFVLAIVTILIGLAILPKNTSAAPRVPTNTPVSGTPIAPTQLSILGAWHCGNDACIWGAIRDLTEFDQKNHWIIDRGNGQPSVNLIILSFIEPLKLLRRTTDATTLNGIPRGITPEIVNYFKSKGIRVMLSIGGITYVTAWNTALAENPTQFGLNAAAEAQRLGVGIEIDYEENSSPNIAGLQTFINAYRSQLPYDATGANHAARLTIDLAAGDRWLIDLTTKATADWLKTSAPVLDYANAMVARGNPTLAQWQEHIDGKPTYSPPIPPLAPAKLAGSFWLTGNSLPPECNNFAASLEKSYGNYAQTVAPNGAGTTRGMLGFMFWAAEREGTRTIAIEPPNTCEGGVGVAATTYNIPIPMPALRQS
jgi:hypothetical protein